MTSAEPVETKTAEKQGFFVRFNMGQRVEHFILMITFTVLAVTGLAQKYSTAGWAEWLILNLGGIEWVRLIHRAFAFLFTLSAIYHAILLVYATWVRNAKLSMMVSLKDFQDIVDAVKYSFGLSDRKPEYGRYDYRQKFEYWGVLFGSLIIIGSGDFMMFPAAVTRFLPGQFVAAAVAFHGNEAMLAVLTIVIWHLYDVIFKPDIFPADTSVFTGKISMKRMREEHALELTEAGVGEETETPPVVGPAKDSPAT